MNYSGIHLALHKKTGSPFSRGLRGRAFFSLVIPVKAEVQEELSDLRYIALED